MPPAFGDLPVSCEKHTHTITTPGSKHRGSQRGAWGPRARRAHCPELGVAVPEGSLGSEEVTPEHSRSWLSCSAMFLHGISWRLSDASPGPLHTPCPLSEMPLLLRHRPTPESQLRPLSPSSLVQSPSSLSVEPHRYPAGLLTATVTFNSA